MTELPSGTVTLLFTDIEGSTRRWERDSDAMSMALKRHDAILREAIEAHHGIVFKTMGDAFCAAFNGPRTAVECAVISQRTLSSAEWSQYGESFDDLRVRMSVHTGVVEARGGDYFGPPLNRAERVLAAGHGGQILLSPATCELVQDELPAGVRLRDLGEHRLPDIPRRVRLHQLVAAGLEREFPPLRTLDRCPNNLPLLPSSFVGRKHDLRWLSTEVDTGRLVTLTGTGGVGKTRLALQAAASIMDQFPDGVWVASLAPISDGRRVADVVANAMALRDEPGHTTLDHLLDFFRHRKLLLVLDNCEHVLDGCSDMVSAVLRSCDGVAVLATSRERLAVEGERLWHVKPLSVPGAQMNGESSDELAPHSSEAVQLFIDRAAAAQPEFSADELALAEVADICRRLDGVPLAIELAAARVKQLPVAEISARLDDRFRLLTGGGHDVVAHHRTLRAAIDWSHDLLPASEQELLRRLSVFRGGWTLIAATAVLGGDDDDEWDVLDRLGHLIDQSLVEADLSGEGRYWLLEMVREFADEKLRECDDDSDVLLRHARYYHNLALQSESELLGVNQAAWLDRLELEHANLRAALDWCVDTGETDLGLEMASALWRFWYVRGHLQVGRSELMRLLSLPDAGASHHRARALHAAGTLAIYQGDLQSARRELESALAGWLQLGDDLGRARSLNNLALVASDLGDYETARDRQMESLLLWRDSGDERMVAILLVNLGHLSIISGELSEAETLLDEGLPLMRRHGYKTGTGDAFFHKGYVSFLLGHYGESEDYYQRSLAVREELEDRLGVSTVKLNLAEMAVEQGDFERAAELHQECLATNRELGDAHAEAEVLCDMGLIACLHEQDEAADHLLHGALALHERVGHKRGRSDALDRLGRLAIRQGDTEKAALRLRASLRLRREMRHWRTLLDSVESCSMLEATRGQPDRAEALLAAAVKARLDAGVPLGSLSRSLIERAVGTDSMEAAIARASESTLSLDEALSQAADWLDSPEPAAS